MVPTLRLCWLSVDIWLQRRVTGLDPILTTAPSRTSKGWMRMRAIMPADCARASEQLSLRLDSELSEFERVLLEAHLARCANCRAFAESVTGLTMAIRNVPAEQPS